MQLVVTSSKMYSLYVILANPSCRGLILIDYSFFQEKDIETSIGTGKKCCSCCWQLSQLLNDSAPIASGGTSLPHFILPPTRTHILPWCPPQFGIPQIILKKLRDELVEQLYFAARLFRAAKLQENSDDDEEDGESFPAPDAELPEETLEDKLGW